MKPMETLIAERESMQCRDKHASAKKKETAEEQTVTS